MNFDPATIFNTIGSLANAAKSIANATSANERTAQLVEFGNVVIQLQAHIASVQNQNASLLRDKDDLEKQIVQLKNWEAEKQRYSLINVHDGLVVYAVKESMSNGESPHLLCPNCFNNDKKSFLNTVDGARGFSMLVCPICKAQMQSNYRGSLSAQYAPG